MRFFLIRAGTKKYGRPNLRVFWAGDFLLVGLLLSADGQS